MKDYVPEMKPRTTFKQEWFFMKGHGSRKTKKAVLGKKISKRDLKMLLSSVKINENKYPESAKILPFEFCPKCGCTETRWTGNMASYPEVWEYTYCLRCGFKVGAADNSPFYHCLEFADDDYRIA